MKIKCRCGELFDTLPQWKLHRDSTPGSQHCEYDLKVEPTDGLPKAKPTPSLPDECVKLLDNGWNVVLFKNGLGSYSAVATKKRLPESVIDDGVITDDFTPAKALYRLTEKVFGNIV